MEVFLRQGAPPPDRTLAWIHLGASHACYAWEKAGDGWRNSGKADTGQRLLVQSPSAVALMKATFADVVTVPAIAETTAVGELREVKAAGYRNFFGVAGPHRFFHTPGDTVVTTGPDILEPVARAFARALRDVAARGEAAFAEVVK